MLVVLSVTELVSWGVLFYAFPVLSSEISAGTGWSISSIMASFSAGLLTSALAGIPVGRWIDRRGPRMVMSAGSLLAGPALLIIATAPHAAIFALGWLVAGVAMGAVLYPPAFTALTRWWGNERGKALTMLTLAGGLASTVFAPLTALLTTYLDWRQTYLVLAIVLLLVTVPGHLFGLRKPWPSAHHVSADRGSVFQSRPIFTSRPFLALVTAFSLAAFASSAVLINLVPLLAEHDIDTGTASIALGLGGAGQVLGRLGYPALTRRVTVVTRTVLVLGAATVAVVVLALADSAVLLIIAAVGAGMARGIFTLLHATAITDRWGASHYGRLTGLLSAPMTASTAIAPWAGSWLAAVVGSYSSAFLILAGLYIAAIALVPQTVPANTVTGRAMRVQLSPSSRNEFHPLQ
ncbi:MFS transporter [Arthrobacter pigmenti]